MTSAFTELPTEAPESTQLIRESTPTEENVFCDVGDWCAGIMGDDESAKSGQAMDIILVTSVSKEELEVEENKEELWNSAKVSSSDFFVVFPFLNKNEFSGVEVQVEVNGRVVSKLEMMPAAGTSIGEMIFTDTSTKKPLESVLWSLVKNEIIILGENSIRYILRVTSETDMDTPYSTDDKPVRNNGLKKKKMISRLNKPSGNEYDHQPPKILGTADANLFLWSSNDYVCVSDIDGTVTKSDILGAMDTIFTERYKHVHPGICSLFSRMASPQYLPSADVHFVYLTARPIKFARSTRKFISSLSQNNQSLKSQVDQSCVSVRLPLGPIFCFPGTLSNVVSMELIKKNTHEFKTKTIVTQILEPFQRTSESSVRNPILAAFGNKNTDRKAYLNSGIAEENIYIISCSSGNISKTASQRKIDFGSEGELSTRSTYLSDLDDINDDNEKQQRRLSFGKIDFSKLISNCSKTKAASRRNSMSSSSTSFEDFQISSRNLNTDHKLEYTGYDDPQLMLEIGNQSILTYRSNKQTSTIDNLSN